MTHKQIWMEIAEAFLTPRSERTSKQLRSTSSGLCWAYGEDFLPGPRYILMQDICSPMLQRCFWLPCAGDKGYSPIHDELRGLMALFFWSMSAKDFNQLLKG